VLVPTPTPPVPAICSCIHPIGIKFAHGYAVNIDDAPLGLLDVDMEEGAMRRRYKRIRCSMLLN
jgi:hypothetical protein